MNYQGVKSVDKFVFGAIIRSVSTEEQKALMRTVVLSKRPERDIGLFDNHGCKCPTLRKSTKTTSEWL